MSDAPWVGSSTPYLAANQGDAWRQEAATRGRSGSQRIAFTGEATPPEDIASQLRLPSGEPAVMRRRLILLDDRPIEIADSFWPTHVARGTALAAPGKIRGGAVTLLAEMGYTPAAVEEEITTRPPTPDERDALELEDGEWVLVLNRWITARDGNPYEASVMVTPGRIGRHHYAMKVDHHDG